MHAGGTRFSTSGSAVGLTRYASITEAGDELGSIPSTGISSGLTRAEHNSRASVKTHDKSIKRDRFACLICPSAERGTITPQMHADRPGVCVSLSLPVVRPKVGDQNGQVHRYC